MHKFVILRIYSIRPHIAVIYSHKNSQPPAGAKVGLCRFSNIEQWRRRIFGQSCMFYIMLRRKSDDLDKNLKMSQCAARGSLKYKGCKKVAIWAPSHKLSGDTFATKALWTIGKKNLLSSNISSTCPHNIVNFGPLEAEIGPVVWGTLANFNAFRALAALLHGTPVLGVSQALRRLTEGATDIQQGGHHVWHWPTFLVCSFFYCFPFSFSHSLYLFSSFVHPFPFYQNSPTPFPGRRL